MSASPNRMTKKDFENLAAMVAELDFDDRDKDYLALKLADVLCTIADAFDPVKFLEMTGVRHPEGEIEHNGTERLRLRVEGIAQRRRMARS